MNPTVIVVLHYAEIAYMKSWAGPIGRSITRLANDVVFFQRALAPKRTGNMVAKMHWNRKVYTTGIGFLAGSSAPYTLYPDQGTRPHVIRAKVPGKYMVFFWPRIGRVARFQRVFHPGSKGQNFLAGGMHRAFRVWDRAG